MGHESRREEQIVVVNNPTSAVELNARTGQIEGLGGFDAGRMEALPDGRWLSLTGDATQTAEQVWPVYDNAAVIWDGAGQRRVPSPHPGGHFFPRFEDGSEFWPLSFFVAGARAYVLGTRVLPTGDMQWTALGGYGAVVDVPAGCDPAWVRYFPTPSSLLDDSAVQWSGAIACDGTWVYVHGVLDRPDVFHARDGGYVARVPLAQVEVPHRWTFWAGSEWSPRADLAVSTIPVGGPSTNGTSAGYTLHRRPDGTWAVTTKRGGELADGLGRYVASTPYGPWTWQQLLPESQVQGLDCYLAGAAPTVPTASGQLLVQWSRRGSTPYWAEVPQ
jgi:hypothetical protein